MSQIVPLGTLSQSGVPVRRRDVIVVRILNQTAISTIQFGGRVLREDGVQVDINEQHPLAVSGVVQEFVIPVVDGWLLSFQANAQAATMPQATMYIECFLSFGSGQSTQRYRTLFSGYLNPSTALAWPRVFRNVPGEGVGEIRTFDIAQPLAGAELLSGSLPEGKWQFKSIHFNLVTDATAISRRVSIEILEDGGGRVGRFSANVAQIASQTIHYNFGVIGYRNVDNTSLIANIGIPDMFMNGDYEINTITDNLQAGDRFSSMSANTNFWAGVQI